MSLSISFLSDFGHSDEFVGVIHGVLAKLAPSSRVIDVTHQVPRGNVRAGALALMRSVQYLPEGVFLAVVDPGVGTARKALAVETPVGVFVGPDNGLLSPAVAMVGGGSRIVSLENSEARIPSGGSTFEGRDIMAPAAALLAGGEAKIEDLGPELGEDDVMPLLLPLPESKGGTVMGLVWWVDGFGNVQTNISPDDLFAIGLRPGVVATVKIGHRLHQVPWVDAYGDVDERGILLHVDANGLMALAVREGRADDELGVSEGTVVALVGSAVDSEPNQPDGAGGGDQDE